MFASVSCDYVLLLLLLLLQHAGDLGNIVAGPDGRASFRLEDSQIKVTRAHTTIVCTDGAAGSYHILIGLKV